VQTFRHDWHRDDGRLVLAPFRGIRYAPQRVSGLAEVTSPPYDVVGPAAAAQLRDSDPHNVIRLTLPAADSAQSRYRIASCLLRQWMAEGVLVADDAPALYVYEERGPDAATPKLQRGLIGAVGLSPPEAGIVLPHEDVTADVVADRRKLMEATEANLEPIFLLYRGGGAASQLVDAVAETGEPMIEAVADGVTHRLWTVTDPASLAAVAADLAHRHALIADGHHRYAAYLDIQRRRRAGNLGRGPWDNGLALLVDSVAYPPRIDPIHRVIPGLPLGAAVELASAAFTVRALPPGVALDAALHELRAAGGGRDRVAFLLADDASFHLLTEPDPGQLSAAAPAGRSERWRWLDSSVLHELLIKTIWGIDDEPPAVRMVHHDAAAAIAAARPRGTAIICKPPQVAEVLAIAAGGEKLPHKSTSFGPKPRTGLVMRSFAYR